MFPLAHDPGTPTAMIPLPPLLLALLGACATGQDWVCSDHGDCGVGQACVEGACQDVECLDSSQCAYGRFCETDLSYTCVSGCQSDDDCLASQVCQEGECYTEPCRNADMDCWIGEFCDTGSGECYTDESITWCMNCTDHASLCGQEGICYSFGDDEQWFCGWFCQQQSDCPSGFTCTQMDEISVCMTDCSFLVDAGWLPPDPTRNSSGGHYGGFDEASGCACESAGSLPGPGVLYRLTLPVLVVVLALFSRLPGRRQRGHPIQSLTMARSFNGSKGFSTCGLDTRSRNSRARGVKAPPVMNTMRSACPGARSRSFS